MLTVNADYMALVSLTPARLADTRPGEPTVDGLFAGEGVRARGSTLELVVTGRGGVDDDAAAVALNVTVTDPMGSGFVTVYPCGETRPLASNVNFTAGAVVPNAVIAKIGDDGKVCLFVSNETHLVVDVNGYFPGSSSYHSINPARVLGHPRRLFDDRRCAAERRRNRTGLDHDAADHRPGICSG